MNNPSKTTINAWIGLSRAHQAAQGSIEKALKQAGMPSLAWYDVLLELERFGPKGARGFELQARLLLPQYGLSRLLARIEKAGYLARLPCKEDGRGQRFAITPAGRDIRARSWVVYSAAIEQALGARLLPSEAQTLLELLEKLR